jgi:hypothetical protein
MAQEVPSLQMKIAKHCTMHMCANYQCLTSQLDKQFSLPCFGLLVVNPVNISPFPAVIRLSLDTEDAGGH